MLTIKENLIAAKALIDTPEKWAHFDEQRVVNGGSCLCALDAVSEIVGNDWDDVGEDERWALLCELPIGFDVSYDTNLHRVAQFNDDPSTKHSDIMELFDRAIAAQD